MYLNNPKLSFENKISNTKFPYQPSSEKDENYYDFIHTSQLRQNGSLSLLEKTYNFPISLFQNGWIIFSSLNIKDGNLKKANDDLRTFIRNSSTNGKSAKY